MSDRYLITGANGQVGRAIQKIFPEAKALGREDLDISDIRQFKNIDWRKYDVIINAAAYVNADESETLKGREKSWGVNAVGPSNLSKVAIEHGIHLIHISSEYVFDGTKSNHLEDESFTPLSVYGQSKSAGDIVVSVVPKHHILRTSWVVGEGHNFVKTMKKLADMRINPKVVGDQYGRLTFASEIVRAIEYILKNDVEYGTYNISNSGEIKSWAEVAKDVFELSGHDRSRVITITTEEYMRDKHPFAPRPTNSDMDLSKIRLTGFQSVDYGPLLEDFVSDLIKVS